MTAGFNAWVDEVAEALRPGGAKADAFVSVLRNGYDAPLRDVHILADALGFQLDIKLRAKREKRDTPSEDVEAGSERT